MTTVELFGEIGWEVTLNEVKDIVNFNKNEDIEFMISSLGGDVAQGLAIHDLIQAHQGNTTARIIGMTASAGTVIALSCDNVEMSENALFLVHNAWTFAMGNSDELEKIQGDLEKIDEILVNIYAKKTGKEKKEIRDLMSQEIWLSADEAKDWGFIDTILQEDLQIAASYNKRLLPKNVINKLENKMKIFKNSKKTYVWDLANGNKVLANAEEPAEGVEVAAIGDDTLDNEMELESGQTVAVEDGKVTEVKEGETDKVDEIVDGVVTAVMDQVNTIITDLKADIDERFNKIRNKGSKGNPPMDKGDVNNAGGDETVDVIRNVRAKVKTQFQNRKKKVEEK